MQWRHLACIAIVAWGCGGKAPATVGNSSPPDTGKAYALAVVVNGWEIWMGNDEVIPAGDPSRYPGALKAIKAAFARSEFTKSAPAGSQGMLITYADKATPRVPMGPITNLTAAAFGEQKDYQNTVGVELVAAVTLAASALDKTKASKKILFVLGDGNDTNNDAARTMLAKLKTDYPDIDVKAFVYKTELSIESEVIALLTADVRKVATLDALEIQLAAALDKLGK